MKPISLYLAVAAVVAIGVGCGIFVVLFSPPGGDSDGPLSGAIAQPAPTTEKPTRTPTPTPTPSPTPTPPPSATTITLARASGCDPVPGMYACEYRLTGVLKDYSGTPVPGRTVSLEALISFGGQWSASQTTTTGTDGSFNFTEANGRDSYMQYRAHWTGDASFAPSTSSTLSLQY